MAIMFAGGMTVAVPSLMPESAADFGATDGMLSVSSTYIQGASILEIVVNDPDISDTSLDINNGASVSIGGTSYDMVQAANGKWYLYVVDTSVSDLMDADTNTGLEYGFKCTAGLGVAGNTSNLIIASGTNVWANALSTSGTGTDAGGCADIDNMIAALDDTSGTTSRQTLTAAVLQNAPALSDNADNATDLGQRGHKLNASGYGSWPYILSIELSSDNAVAYGSDSINVEFGNNGNTAIGLTNQSPSDTTEIHLSITDPALNIDPTTADAWLFDLDAAATASSVVFANNGTSNTALSPSELAVHGCVDNCRLTSDAVTQLIGYDDVVMSESGANTGYFESFDLNGVSEISTKDEATGDSKTVFQYDGNYVDMIITYNGASLDFDAGGDWAPATAATITVTDADLNKNPTSDETLSIGNSTHVIPTIKVGSPLTLAGGNNPNMEAGDNSRGAFVSGSGGTGTTKVAGISVGSATGGNMQGVNIYNTTDNSERLRIIHNSTEPSGNSAAVTTWINVTTGHTRADIVALAGTVALNYDVSGPAGLVDSTEVLVYVTDDGDNGTDNASGSLGCVTTGNARAGVCDLGDASTYALKDRDETAAVTWSGGSHAGTNYVNVNFKITHAAGDRLSSTDDYAIAADFCNFDQQNASLTHNCIYRLEASETGDNTGVFSGTVEYITLNNSTTGDKHGEHGGSDREAAALMTGMNGDALIVVLMDSASGSDAIRVLYNDTDALQQADKLIADLDTMTHTGTVDLDSDTYEADDMATITIVDPDLNQDSAIRDTYENSTSTFKMTVTGSTGTAHQPFATKPMTIIETTPTSGIFVGTFKVPDYNGQDMELTYYESKDAGGNAVEYYDTATISSNSGSIALSKSVYPVPFTDGDLYEGNGDTSGMSGAGNVTMTLSVTDADFTGDTLTTASTTAAGTILVKLIEGGTTSTCFTAGSTAASTDTGAGKPSTTTVQELGPLSSVDTDGGTYEISFTIDEYQHCGSNMRTVTAGDIIQVEYVDASDANGDSITVYDSSTFDLRTGSLSVDKDVYVLGSDMVVTLTDPDLNVDGSSIDTYGMDLLEWDSDAASSQLLDNEGITATNANSFTSNPSSLQETGSDTGVFQTVVTLPTAQVNSTTIDYGEAVILTYKDVGLAGEDSVEDDSLDVEAYFSISNFGALIELDKAVYGWKDTVYITITSPDHNVNSASEEQIGTSALPIQVTTRSGKMCTSGNKTYLADESGPDTGVFTAEVQLSGFDHTMSSDTSATSATATTCGSSSSGGIIKTSAQTDGVSVSYEYNDATVVVASASVVWNIGEASFDSSAVSAGGSSTITVVDSDENVNDEIIDTFTVAVYSDSDNGGFSLTMNETDENTGVFEGTVYFTTDAATSGSNLRVSEGDTVTAEYTDETLPEPYTTSDDLTIAATTTVGTAFPPLERAPAANARVVDAFGSSVAEVSVDQQVQIAADVSNGQSSDQAFAYLVQVQDGDGVTVSLAWITGSLTAGQSMSPALSWTPDAAGAYTATVFVWESVDNPTALSPTVSVTIDVV